MLLQLFILKICSSSLVWGYNLTFGSVRFYRSVMLFCGRKGGQNIVRKVSFLCICQHALIPSGLSVTSHSKQKRSDWLLRGRWNGSDGGVKVFLMAILWMCSGFSGHMKCNAVTRLKLFPYWTIAGFFVLKQKHSGKKKRNQQFTGQRLNFTLFSPHSLTHT